VVVHGQRAVLVCNLRVIKAKETFKQNDRPCLKLNRLQEISKFELNSSDLNDASSNILSHGPGDLQQQIVCLTVKLKSFIHLGLFKCSIALTEKVLDIRVFEMQMLEHGVHLGHV